jgi:hypothetical protein
MRPLDPKLSIKEFLFAKWHGWGGKLTGPLQLVLALVLSVLAVSEGSLSYRILYALLAILAFLVTSFQMVSKEREEKRALQKTLIPKLKCSFGKDISGCVVDAKFGTLNAYYYRVRIESNCIGDVAGCMGHLVSIKRNGTTLFAHESIAMPIAPGWRDNPTIKDIRDKVPEYLDVFFITDQNKIVLPAPNFLAPSTINYETLFSEPGEYVFHMIVSAPSTVSEEIDVPIKWTGDRKTSVIPSGRD